MKKLNKKQILTLAIVAVVLIVVGATAVLVGTYVTGWSGFHFYAKPEANDIKIACVGDSITYGFGVTDYGNKNYPKQLDTLLGDGYCVNNYGHSGATVQEKGDQPYYEYGEYKASLEFDADILILMMGTNDTKPYNWVDADTFKAEYLKRPWGYFRRNQIFLYFSSSFGPSGVTFKKRSGSNPFTRFSSFTTGWVLYSIALPAVFIRIVLLS